MRTVVYYGDPILRKIAKPVTVFDQELKNLVEEMKVTMMEYDGVGLAAPQVGKSIQLVIIDATHGEQPPLVFINPEITYLSKEKEVREEGCLSFPGIHLDISRPSIVSVNAVNENGVAFTIENATELLARAIQHEADHLNGILIIDQVSALKRKMLSGKLKRIAAGDIDKDEDDDEE
jgi:peptide deformylase